MKTSVGPTAHAGYRPDVDGLRAIAVTAVVGFHAFPRFDPGGFVGVDIFFVISGFLISTIIAAKLEEGRFSFVDFYSRRARRIFPALIVVLLAGLAAGWFLLLPGEYQRFGKHVAGASVFISNLMLLRENGYFDISADAKPLLHLWSLGIEEQFYLLWPVLLLAASRARGWLAPTWLVPVVTGALALVSFGYCLHASSPAFFSPAARWWELMVGGLLAQLIRHRGTLSGLPGEVVSALGLALVAGTLLLLDEWQPFPGWWALAPVLGTAMMMFAGPEAWLNRIVLSNRLMVGCGLISYPLYLWHWPLLSFARIWQGSALGIGTRIAIVVSSVVLAWLTYEFIERPIRSGRTGKVSAAGLFAFLSAIGAMGLTIYLAEGVAWRPVVAQKRAPIVTQEFASDHISCADHASLPPPLAVSCFSHVNKGARRKVVVWGDSHGAAWSTVLERLAARDGFELYVFSVPGCAPLVGVRMSFGHSAELNCFQLETSRETLDSILALHPDVVLLAARWSLYSQGWVRNGELLRENTYLTTKARGIATPESSRRALTQAIPDTVKRLQEANIAVIVLKNPPVLPASVNNLRKSIADLQVPIEEHRRVSRFTDDILDGLKSVDLIDPATTLCRPQCRVEGDGAYYYIDDNHLSVQGALVFDQAIGDVLSRRLRERPLP